MDAATWVALVIGLGSLATTLVLDRRNRTERRNIAEADSRDREKRDSAERAEREARDIREYQERERTRWLDDRKSTYLRYVEAVVSRETRLSHIAGALSVDYDASQELPSSIDSSTYATQLEILAPPEIAEIVTRLEGKLRSAEWTAAVHSASAGRDEEGSTGNARAERAWDGLTRELEDVSLDIEHLRSAIRRDLGVMSRNSAEP